MLSFLTLMLVLPGLAAAAAYVAVAISLWLEGRETAEGADASGATPPGRVRPVSPVSCAHPVRHARTAATR